ncbi:MAG: PilN domain-containing protein [Methylophilaceae bacterium]|jgi:type IV pilus assembly protein PilN|uniref:PilN domain-containing protein n=1 Tax=Methylobacillus sp. MM3 TaxID=1848039 RepID=UPI0007E15556|nr:PilN domain-containing protein [Methylobacillus sp. MM3]OAJ70623.1 fimbrial protein [Methylobacillus sp. MM3]
MAVRINLLPYRKIRRAERQRQFNMMLVGTLIAGVAVVFLGNNYISGQIETQMERNTRLENAIVQLDKEIAEIKDLKTKISAVLERKRVVENLQSGRSQAVILLDEIARLLPEGIYLKGIRQQGNVVTLDGVADTNARVATLVRNFGGSSHLESPELIEIHTISVNNLKQSAFTVSVKQKLQQADEGNKQ